MKRYDRQLFIYLFLIHPPSFCYPTKPLFVFSGKAERRL